MCSSQVVYKSFILECLGSSSCGKAKKLSGVQSKSKRSWFLDLPNPKSHTHLALDAMWGFVAESILLSLDDSVVVMIAGSISFSALLATT